MMCKHISHLFRAYYISKVTRQLACLNSFNLFFFFFVGATLVGYGSSWARGGIAASTDTCATATASGIWVTSATYTAALGNARSLAHWVRPGIEPTSSWTYWVLTHWATTGTPSFNLHHNHLKNVFFTGVPVVTQWKQIQLGTMRLWVRSLALLSGVRIWRGELWYRSQMRLRSGIAVALV